MFNKLNKVSYILNHSNSILEQFMEQQKQAMYLMNADSDEEDEDKKKRIGFG
jgi:hypothetical protein